MNIFDKLHKLKNDLQHDLEKRRFVYHGGFIVGDKMDAVMYVSLRGEEYKITIERVA